MLLKSGNLFLNCWIWAWGYLSVRYQLHGYNRIEIKVVPIDSQFITIYPIPIFLKHFLKNEIIFV